MRQSRLTRRNFVSEMVQKSTGILIGGELLSSFPSGKEDFTVTEPLFDLTLWKKYRQQVQHPSLVLKSRNLEIAKENIQTHQWARNFVRNLEATARRYLVYTHDDHLQKLIGETTPGDPLWTPCPACRDQDKPMHPHGLWKWEVETYDRLECTVCGTVFPHEKYPESIVFQTKWGKPQQLTFYGGETFTLFGFPRARPTFSGNIRSRGVEWCSDYARVLAETYLLTDKPEFAVACKKILLRLAECYPNWLVHVGYGEYADMDPRIAAQYINELPRSELTPPPNEPDRKLWTGYWSAGRARGVGLESDFVMKVTEAYDLTCSAATPEGAVYSEADRLRIEKDLLLESTALLVCDKKINNKSVRNRTAAGLVGICVGHPELFRFGLEGFTKTVEEWFLKDGTTSESPVYGMMTLKGIWALAEAAKGYSDPAGYLDKDGKRIDGLDLYQKASYKRVFEGIYNGLQGDLTYPPYADSFNRFRITASYVDLMAANYPENPSYYALLEELCGIGLTAPSGPAPAEFFNDTTQPFDVRIGVLVQDEAIPNENMTSFSLYFRKPGTRAGARTTVSLPDWCPESLRIGHMRTGADGRESLLTLSASHWGVHHHRDSLNLYYWKSGQEILSDLGYIWDHPMKDKTVRTLAHHTVLIDEKDQQTTERGGNVDFFRSSDQVKVMRASSNAYPEASVYNRTSALIDHGSGDNYAVDFFEAEGGDVQDYVFHLGSLEYTAQNIRLAPTGTAKVYDFEEVQAASAGGVWSISWPAGPGLTARAWVIPAGEEVFIGKGWGQRDWKNTDVGAQIPYVVRRTRGKGRKKFMAVFEGYSGENPFVKSVRFLKETGIVEITTRHGTDLVASAAEPESFRYSGQGIRLEETGRFIAYLQNKYKEPARLIIP